MRGFWQSNTGYLERTCRNDHRLAKMKTERSLMFAYVRLKSLMFAYFEKKYFFPALWSSGAGTPWIAEIAGSGWKTEAKGGDRTIYPTVEGTAGQNNAGGLVHPSRTLRGGRPGFALGGGFFADMKAVF